jgi:acetyltransferase-like isoleucine patch superfamily enzyme
LLLRIVFSLDRILKRGSWSFWRKNKNIQIGAYTYGIPTVLLYTDKYHVTIGKFCSISQYVRIIVDLGSNHRPEWISTYPFEELMLELPRDLDHHVAKGDMTIGNDVWIGEDEWIMLGVQIGDGAIIATGSVVTKNVGDYEIVGGNPARHIRNRFTDEQIRALKEIKWWDWPIEKVKAHYQAHYHLLQSSDIDEFIEAFR